MANTDVREAIKKARVFGWEVAESLGISESHFSRKLRRELPDEEKAKIFAAIEKLSKGVC